MQDKKPAAVDDSHLGMSPREVLHAIVRRRWLILASTIAVGVAVTVATMRQPKVYRGIAQIQIDPVQPRFFDAEEGFDNISELARSERAFTNTQYELLKGRMVLRRAVAALGLDKDEKYLQAANIPKDREDLVDAVVTALRSQLIVEPRYGSRIVQVIIEDLDPDRAARIANGVAQAYQDQTLDLRLDTTRGASEWLDKRVAEYADKLADNEKTLLEFRRANMLLALSVEDRQGTTGAKLATLNQKLVETRTNLIMARAKRSVLENELKEKNGELEKVSSVAANLVVSGLKADLARLKVQRAELSSRYGPLHHTMVAVDKQISEVSDMLRAEINVLIQGIDQEIATLVTAEAGINADIEIEKKGAMELNELALQHNILSRDYGMTKMTYEQLLKKQTEADLSGSTNTNYVHWFERAEVNPNPVRPLVVRSAAMGVGIGLFLGLLIAVAGILLDNTVHSQADVEEGLGLTFLGILPRIQGEAEKKEEKLPPGERPNRDLYIVKNPKSSLAECARSIRTNLLFMGTDAPLKRLLVTSPGPSEGKSTIAVNLSIAMAQAGNRVLLVDTDLRRPRLHQTFGVSGEHGLTSMLLNEAKTEVIKSTEVPGLEVLPCGPLPPNPAELMHTDRFKKLLEELDKRYDLIVLDSPPIGAVTDAAILSQLSDGTLLIAKAAKTTKEAVRRARRQLLSVNANIIGMVLNDVDLEQNAYGYTQYYYRRYGYGSDAEKGSAA